MLGNNKSQMKYECRFEIFFLNFHKNETAKAFDLDGKRARLMHLIIQTVKNSLLLL